MKKQIYIIGTVGVPACYGGFESLVENLLNFTPEDVEYTVFCSAKNYEEKLEIDVVAPNGDIKTYLS